jgi:Predicted membrane protein
MWNLSLPWWEFVLRGVIVYVFLLIILRMTGKRQTGQLAPFDLVLLLVLSNAVQNAMNGGDNTVLGGIISATTLIVLHHAVAFMTYKSKKLEAWIEGTPRTLIHDGVLNEGVMRSEFLTHHELAAALRAAGCAEIEHVRVATLENNGQITISLRPHST